MHLVIFPNAFLPMPSAELGVFREGDLIHVDGRIVEKSGKIYCFMPLCLSVLSSKPNCAQNLWFPLGPLQWKCLPKRLTEDIKLSQLGVSDPKLCLSQDPRLHRKSPISKVDKSQVSGEFWRRENSTLKKEFHRLMLIKMLKERPLVAHVYRLPHWNLCSFAILTKYYPLYEFCTCVETMNKIEQTHI